MTAFTQAHKDAIRDALIARQGKFKTCKGCGVSFPLAEFPRRAKTGPRESRCLPCLRAYQSEKAKRHWATLSTEERRKRNAGIALKRYHGLTQSQFDEIRERQLGKCAICERIPENDRLVVDHDHDTKVIRGLLCDRCNRALGLLEDDVSVLRSALRYLSGNGTGTGLLSIPGMPSGSTDRRPIRARLPRALRMKRLVDPGLIRRLHETRAKDFHKRGAKQGASR